jgi:hypothetical protein
MGRYWQRPNACDRRSLESWSQRCTCCCRIHQRTMAIPTVGPVLDSSRALSSSIPSTKYPSARTSGSSPAFTSAAYLMFLSDKCSVAIFSFPFPFPGCAACIVDACSIHRGRIGLLRSYTRHLSPASPGTLIPKGTIRKGCDTAGNYSFSPPCAMKGRIGWIQRLYREGQTSRDGLCV